MSADFINSIGNRSPQITPAVTSRPVAEVPSSPPAPQVAPEAPSESFSVSHEARESSNAGEAWAAQFAGAFGGAVAPPVATAGQLQIQGGENTAQHAVHGIQNGAYRGSNSQEAGFTAATVYAARPPVA